MILHGDCMTHLKALDSDSLDSLVTDPPAGIAFMGKDWDKDKGGRAGWVAWMTDVMRECHRVLKPGAHGLVWAIPRTSHWTMTALEDAGFEIRDVVTHLFGSGFPKSMDVSKAIDKAAGAEREVVGERVINGDMKGGKMHASRGSVGVRTVVKDTTPSTDAARQWQGFGTALKPACEFWVLIRKPCSEKTVAANVLKHGTGALNIDACRVGTEARHNGPASTTRVQTMGRPDHSGSGWNEDFPGTTVQGRFPANLVLTCCGNDPHDEGCAVRMLDEQSLAGGMHSAGKARDGESPNGKGMFGLGGGKTPRVGDSGGASRFFYVAKASKSDRNRGVK